MTGGHDDSFCVPQRLRGPGNGLNHTAVTANGEALHTCPPAAKRVRNDEPSSSGVRLEI